MISYGMDDFEYPWDEGDRIEVPVFGPGTVVYTEADADLPPSMIVQLDNCTGYIELTFDPKDDGALIPFRTIH